MNEQQSLEKHKHLTHRFSSPSDGLRSCSLGMCSIHLNSIQQPIVRDWGKPHPRMQACHSPLGRGQSVKQDRILSLGGSREGGWGGGWGLRTREPSLFEVGVLWLCENAWDIMRCLRLCWGKLVGPGGPGLGVAGWSRQSQDCGAWGGIQSGIEQSECHWTGCTIK